jgi:DNA-binding NtrC family response regulator
VTPMEGGHLLVARFSGAPPAVADMRALIAAVEAVLSSGNPPRPAGVSPGDRRDPELRRFGSPLHRIAGLSEIINECKRRAGEFATSGSPVLLSGEVGTGRSLFARVIHDLSKRSSGPFTVVDQGAASNDGAVQLDEALEDLAGTGASPALGTVFMRDLGALPLDQQELVITRATEASSADPRGSQRPRVIVSVTGSVEDGVAAGAIHAALATAFGAHRLELPPLRVHAEDIPLLVTHFQREVGGRRGGAGSGFTVGALEALASYEWPGNVGELRAEVLRLMTRAASDLVVGVADLSPHIREMLVAIDAPLPDLGALAARPLADARNEFERWRIQRALVDAGWNQSLAAQRLGLSRAGLFKKMRKLGIVGTNGGRS